MNEGAPTARDPETPRFVLRERIRGLQEKNHELEQLHVEMVDQLGKSWEELHKTLKDLVEEIRNRQRAEEEADRAMSQLVQGQKLQALGQLSAALGHEIQSPVAFILGNLKLMESAVAHLARQAEEGKGTRVRRAGGGEAKPAPAPLDELKSAIMDCKEGATRIHDLVKNLREFASPAESELKRMDLHKVLETALRLCSNEIHQQATVELALGKSLNVLCQPQRLSQVFVNLLLNAGQAIEEARRPGAELGRIRIATSAEEGQAVVRIRDTDGGISAENLKKLFQPFFTTKTAGRGMGLGLFVAHKIMAAHGGTISVESKAGKGAEFTVSLPLKA